jgi:capsular polysaccharide biosynthesis protein
VSSVRTFIIPGGCAHLARMIDCLNESVCGILVHEHLEVAQVLATVPGVGLRPDRIYSLRSLVQTVGAKLAPEDCEAYDRCLKEILSDPRVHYLATRSSLNTAFNNAIVIEKIVINSLLIIRKTRPARLMSGSTPHSVEAWVFAKTCEFLGVPVYILERTPINNRAWVYRGMDTQDVVLRQAPGLAEGLTSYSKELIREQREARPGAKDKHGFYVSRMDMSSVSGSNTNNWWSYRRELGVLSNGSVLGTPLRALSVYMKNRLYRSYRRLAVNHLPDSPFVIFFMHYQPERSSLPEGLFHVQQWTALRMLSMALPGGWSLLVREHPTTWLQPLDISVRTIDLYDQVAQLPNTKVCSMDLDTFEIIDRCEVVATLTGSVGFQAILRNRPVIAFGLPAYKDHPASLPVRTASELFEALRVVRNGELRGCFSDEKLEKYLLWVEQNSVCADENERDWLEARLKNFTALFDELLRDSEAIATRQRSGG